MRHFTLLILTWLILVAGNLLGEADRGEFSQAAPDRMLHFPRDHGKHPDFQTEWWYFTGNLSSSDREFGFQLTFFRRSLYRETPQLDSNWAARDLYPAHFAITDKRDKRFFHFEMMSRQGPNLAGAAEDDLKVHVRNWNARRSGDQIVLDADKEGVELKLVLTPLKPIVLHGMNGYSRKGANENQSSHYYSYTRLAAEGSVKINAEKYAVKGLAWMDHEFGSSILTDDQVGWDWFSLQLDDGTDLMVFHLRKKDGRFETPFGTIVSPDGKAAYLAGDDINIISRNTWRSPDTGASYPAAWTISLKGTDTTLEIVPAASNQELSARKSTQAVYWEGAVQIHGRHQDRDVTGSGYAELTGYAHSMGGRL